MADNKLIVFILGRARSHGLIEGEVDTIGNDASGVITRVGSAIKHVKVGDRAIAMHSGCYATRKVLLGSLVAAIPRP